MRYLAVGLILVVACTGTTDPAITIETSSPATTKTTTEAPVTTTVRPVPTTTQPATTTTRPAPTTTEDDQIITAGVYEVGTEIVPGTYRFVRYMARLDENLEIIDNALVSQGDGVGLMIVLETDAYAEVSVGAINVLDSNTLDPIGQGFTDGTYLVGVDIQPGRYRITPVGGSSTYWARLDNTLDIIDNDLSDGQLIVIVKDLDFALSISGSIELMP